MSTLVAIATGFLAIIVVGTAAAWLHDLLEARWDGLSDRARRARRSAVSTTRHAVRPVGGHRHHEPAYVYAVRTRRVAAHPGSRDRLLRS